MCMVFDARNFHSHMRMELKAAPRKPAITKLTSRKGSWTSLGVGGVLVAGQS